MREDAGTCAVAGDEGDAARRHPIAQQPAHARQRDQRFFDLLADLEHIEERFDHRRFAVPFTPGGEDFCTQRVGFGAVNLQQRGPGLEQPPLGDEASGQRATPSALLRSSRGIEQHAPSRGGFGIEDAPLAVKLQRSRRQHARGARLPTGGALVAANRKT